MKDYYLPGEERFGAVASYLYTVGVKLPDIQRFYRFVVEDLTKSGVEKLLDVGTGPGDIPLMLSRTGKFKRIFAIDPSETMIKIAKRRARSEGISNIVFGIGSSRHIPFDKKFDLIFASISYHHWEEKVYSMKHISHFLRAGGEIRLYEFNGDRKTFMMKLFAPTHVLKKKELYEVAEEAGLKVKGIIEAGRFVRVSLSKP